jgi:hypothetical protein
VSKPDYQLDLLADRFADADTAWSIGSFGAIAEFMRDADEPRAVACGSLRMRKCDRSLRNH